MGPCGLIIEAFGPEIRPWLRRAERLFYPRLGDRPRDVPPLRDAALGGGSGAMDSKTTHGASFQLSPCGVSTDGLHSHHKLLPDAHILQAFAGKYDYRGHRGARYFW